jgi:recombination protein RecR
MLTAEKHFPQIISQLISFFDTLPGIGPKSAARLVFYLLRLPESDLKRVSVLLSNLKKKIRRCKNCFHWTTDEICSICLDGSRDKNTICVVEDSLDLVVIESAGRYNGVYHVLEGAISPLEGIGPEDLRISELVERVKNSVKGGKEVEVIIATNTTMEGEATAMYIRDILKNIGKVKITRVAQGLPSGADIEYADHLTIVRALEQRSEYK